MSLALHLEKAIAAEPPARGKALLEALAALAEGRPVEVRGAGPTARLVRAVVLRAQGKLEEASAEAARAGDAPEVVALRSELLSDLGRVEEALAELAKLPESVDVLLRTARCRLQRRNYPEALAALDRAMALAPSEPAPRLLKAQALSLTDRLDEAIETLGELDAHERARLLIQRRRLAEAERALKPLKDAEAEFLRGCLDWQRGKGSARLKKLAAAGDPKARLYWLAHDLPRRLPMKKARTTGPKLYLCGLGIFPPYTASLEVLHAISRCDVAFNNVAGPEVRQLLSQLCPAVRPAAYQAWQDEPTWADAIFAELDKGRQVAFVTRGHPLVFGALAVELVRRSREREIPCESFGAVSSLDHLLAKMGTGLGDAFAGVQVFDRPAVEGAEALNVKQPLLACFYAGVEGKPKVAAFVKSLSRFYPPAHKCLMFGPKYDSPPVELALRELPERYPDIHPSLMLYVPARRDDARL